MLRRMYGRARRSGGLLSPGSLAGRSPALRWSLRWSGQPLGDDLMTQLQALGADPGAGGRGQAGHLVAALAAEAALLGSVLHGDRFDDGRGRPGRLTGGDRLAGHGDAAITDVDAG